MNFLAVLLGAINIYSIKLASRIQVVLTVAKLIALTIIILGGVVKLCQGETSQGVLLVYGMQKDGYVHGLGMKHPPIIR